MNNNTNAGGATFDPYLTWLGIRDPQRPPNHYRLLGLELFESDPDVIASAADRQMAYIRTYQAGQQGEHSQRILNELTTAKLCLLKPERKREYDQRLQAAQKPAAPPPGNALPPAQARPFAAAMPPQGQPAAPPQTQPRPISAAPPRLFAQPLAGEAYADNSPSFATQPGSMRTNIARPEKSSAALQWSIVGGLVLAVVILAVILANKFGGNEPTPIAENPTPKVTPTGTKTPPVATNGNPPPISNAQTPENTTPENTDPKNTEPKNTEPQNTATSNPATIEPAPMNPSPAAKNDPTKERPGPVKAPLPNVALPGIEEPSTPTTNPLNPATNPPSSVSPAPATPLPMAPTPTTVATNNDPLNSLPTSTGNSPTMPAPMPMGNPTNPLTEPPNPLTTPNPLDVPAPAAMPQPVAPRRPIPSAKEIAESRAAVRDIFKTEYSGKVPTLGKTLLKSARESSDKPAIMYTAYDEARLVSAALNDPETAFVVHEELTREFAVEPDKDLLETIKAVAKSAVTMTPDNAGSVLDIINEQAAAAIMDQRLDTAEQLLRYVSNFSSRVPDKAQRDTVFRDLQKRLVEHRAFAAKAVQYKEALAKNPDDGEANLELGKFWAFQQGNYKLGLTYLAKGSDTEIREAAKYELTIPVDSPEFGKVGAAWWEVANKLPPDPKAAVKVHAAYSYARALPKLKSLDRGLAETRINEAYKLFRPSNAEVKEIITLLLTRTNWKMQWKGRTYDSTLSFNTTGTCSSEEYPTWKLLDNMGVVCFRDRDRIGNPFAGMGGGFGKRGMPFGGGNNTNNNNDNTTKTGDVTRNVMQIVIPTANRIEVRVLDGEGKLRGEGSGIPE